MEPFVDLLRGARRVVFFTGAGAGASTEPPTSLPDFRSATGLWRNRTLAQTLTRSTFLEDPDGFWATFREVLLPWRRARPNAVHRAPSRLAALGKEVGVVTQNIDGLDARCSTGHPVYELHGHLRTVTCPGCGMAEPAEAFEDRTPRCGCGEFFKPDVVLFEDPLDIEGVFLPAQALIEQADLLVVIGTSLTVAPANALILGSPEIDSVVLNRDPTPIDERARLVDRRPAGEVLAAALDRLERRCSDDT